MWDGTSNSNGWGEGEGDDVEFVVPREVEEVLRRQEDALLLLEALRQKEPAPRHRPPSGGGRRDFRRWPAPEGVTVELHDGVRWWPIACRNIAVAGASVELPAWAGEGPVPARLSAPHIDRVLVLADVMWRNIRAGVAGVRFEFKDHEERDIWTGGLVDALLDAHLPK
jgi:hypothetical protein